MAFPFLLLTNDMKHEYKQYTRNGKKFWRNYGRNVKGGITSVELMQLHIEAHKEYMTTNLATNIYSLNKSEDGK